MPEAILVLASASPRRRLLLEQIGVPCDVDPADVDETRLPGESPADYVQRLAVVKARSVASRHTGRPVLAADTTVVIDEDTLGKPRDRAEGLAMLQRLSGRTHLVMTGVGLCAGGTSELLLVTTEVEFAQLAPETCEAYLDTPEPWDKAGGYGIQGLAGALVKEIRGSYSNVVGLPLHETWQLLRKCGVPTPLEPPVL